MKTSHILQECTEVRNDWKLAIATDMVLRAQGADPKIVRARQPQLVALAERAIAEGMPLIHPKAAIREMQVLEVASGRVFLDGGAELHSMGPARLLAGAESIVAVVATVGGELEQEIERLRGRDLLYQLALDGFGTAAISEFTAAITRDIHARTTGRGQSTAKPLYPGMAGWELAAGQSQIFSLVDGGSVGVALNSCHMMTPRKSVSFVVGMGRKIRAGHDTCNQCEASDRCRHKPAAD